MKADKDILNEWKAMFKVLKKSMSKLQAHKKIAKAYNVARTTVFYNLEPKARKKKNEYMIEYRGNKFSKERKAFTRHLGLTQKQYNTYYVRICRNADYFFKKIFSDRKIIDEKELLLKLWEKTGIEFSRKSLDSMLINYEKGKQCLPLYRTMQNEYMLNHDYYAGRKINSVHAKRMTDMLKKSTQRIKA